MKQAYDPRHLSIETFAKTAAQLEGQMPLADLDRLSEVAQGQGPASVVTYTARGLVRHDAAGGETIWLQVSAHTTFPMTCQRCLTLSDTPVGFERDFRFVATEAQAEAEDDSAEEDVLVLSRDFDLLGLVEDELLMALPLVPMHAQCPQAVRLQAVDADFDDSPPPQAHPFAALAQLKNKT